MRALVADAAGAADVIVAPATPPGSGALAVVRLSGPPGATLAVARRLAPGLPREPEPRRAHLSRFVDEEGRPIDEGLLLFFGAPASATGEEVVELQAHGARAVVRALVTAACRAGARPARPGEFTRRALANGKLDLARAEAVAGLAGAASRGEARRALGLFDGALSRAVGALHARALALLAELEAALDFVEDVPPLPRAELVEGLGTLGAEVDRLARAPLVRADGGARTVAILGRPNAGKSTLFNALLGEDRAIVTAHPGTTRDVLSEEVELAGEAVRLLDTAGLRRAPEGVEEIGVARARAAAAEAALVVYLVDGTAGTDAEDREALEVLESLARPVLLVRSKADVSAAADDALRSALAVSARTGEGMEALGARIAEALGARGGEEGEIALLARHREALARAGDEIASAREDLAAGEEFAAAALRRALHALGEITGETAGEELLERIFAGFCVGK